MKSMKEFIMPLEDKIKEIVLTEKDYVLSETKNLHSINILLSAFFNKEEINNFHLEIMKAIKGFEAKTLIIDKIIDNPKTADKEMKIIVSFILQSIMTKRFLKALEKLDISAENRILALEKWNEVLRHVYFGEGLDVLYSNKKIKPLNFNEYFFIIKETTAIFFQLPLFLGCLIKKINKKETEKILEFGLNLGIAFQIKDDYNDFENDIWEGKQRIFLIKESLELLTEKEKNFIFEKYPDKKEEIIEIIKNSKIMCFVKEKIDFYINKALENIKNVDGNYINLLKEIANLIRVK